MPDAVPVARMTCSPAVRELGCLALVRPQRGDPGPANAAYTGGLTQSGQSDGARRPGRYLVDVHESLRAAACGEAREGRRRVEARGGDGELAALICTTVCRGARGRTRVVRVACALPPDRTKEHLSWICPSPAPIAAT